MTDVHLIRLLSQCPSSGRMSNSGMDLISTSSLQTTLSKPTTSLLRPQAV